MIQTLELMEEEKKEVAIAESEAKEEQATELITEKTEEVKAAKIFIVDSTSYSIRKEDVFYNKRREEVEFELLDRCKTTVIHSIKEVDLQIISENEEEVNQTLEAISKVEDNTMALLEVRRDILKIAKAVLSKRAKKRLLKKFSELDAIIMNEKLD